jgi:purine-binding chemotaxis protein CheW
MAMKTEAKKGVHKFRAVRFRINDIPYAVDIRRIREIIYYRPVTPLPEAPPFVEGVFDLRGTVIPVIDLKKKIGVGNESGEDPNHILILRMGDRLVGMIVDEVQEVFEIEEQQIQDPQKIHRGPGSRYLTGVCKINDHLVFLLDMNAILTDEEQSRLGGIDA